MKKLNMGKIMNETAKAIITDEYNTTVYDTEKVRQYLCEGDDGVLMGTLRMNVEGTKETADEKVAEVVSMLESLNGAFCRSVGAPESMKMFKVLGKKARYAGNNTVCITVDVAMLGSVLRRSSSIHTLMDTRMMGYNIIGTNGITFRIENIRTSEDKLGLGNALRSWNVVKRRVAGAATSSNWMNSYAVA